MWSFPALGQCQPTSIFFKSIWMMEDRAKLCVGCSCDTAESKNSKKCRRLLSNHPQALAVLYSVLQEQICSEQSVDEQALNKRYVCQKCFGASSSYLKLKEKLSNSLESIRQNAKKSLPHVDKNMNIGEKRLCSESSVPLPPKKQRLQQQSSQSTGTRVICQGDSPAVSVCILN